MNLRTREAEEIPARVGAEVRFTEAEITALMNEAMARQRAAEGQLTLADAKEIAESLDIPEEHVVGAAEEILRRRGRETRRLAVREQRLRRFRTRVVLWASVWAFVFLRLLRGGGTPPTAAFLLLLLTALPAALAFFRWRFAPVTDEEADRAELPPAAGVCRVCGGPAASGNSTFCAAHQYRGPG